MPTFRALLGGGMTVERLADSSMSALKTVAGRSVVLRALDACLGVPGLPQSATGQTALLTGENAPALLERHLTGFLGPRLRDLLLRRSLLLRARAAGRRVAFANAFTAGYFAALVAGRRRHAAFTMAALAAGAPLRDLDHLARGEAVTWDICGDLMAGVLGGQVTERSPEQAGGLLAGLLRDHDLVVFETFLTDLAGHRRLAMSDHDVLARLDGLVAGVLAELPADATLVLTSDHGNLEDDSHRAHTTNPVPLLAVGEGAATVAAASSLLDMAPAVLAVLDGTSWLPVALAAAPRSDGLPQAVPS